MGFLFLSLFFFVGAVSATNHTVTPSDSIQSKIDGSNAGDTLNLATGTYYQYNIKVNKSLTIAGPTTTGTPTAVIDAQNQGRVFYITTDVNVTLKYLTIKNGNASKDTYNPDGGGILNNGNCTILGCKINSNTATYGGGIINYIGNCTVTGSNINSNTATYGGGIYNYGGNCTVTGSNINSNTVTSDGGGIYNDHGTCTVTGSNINSNTATNSKGGGIYNYGGNCTVTGSNINSNTAKYYGGGIYNYGGNCTVTGSNINSNTANSGGGGIANDYGTVTVTGSNINSNTANYGGGIYNYRGTCTVTGCNFELNKAGTCGNAIYNENGDTSTRIFHFNRFYDTNPGYEIYSSSGSVDAMLNWWGSNTNPSNKVYGTVDTSPWLILKVTANPTLIGNGVKSDITADLRYDSLGSYHNLTNGYFPNNIPIQFTTTLGSITSPVSTLNGTVKATLTGGSTSGVADVFVLLDDEIVATTVNIDAILPTIITIDPANNAVNVARDKVIKVTFSEPVKAGSMWIELYNSVGTKTLLPITTSISGNVLTINHAALLANGTKYILAFHTGSVTDMVGNSLAGVARYFTTSTDGTAPSITSTDPVNNAVNVPRNKVITVTFNEPVKAGSMWIELYNAVGTITLIPITTSISGNVLTINHAALLATGTKYILAFHTGSITDAAGNPVASAVRYFTTANT